MAATMISGTKRVAAISDGDYSVNDVSLFRDTRQKMTAYKEPSDTIFECRDGKEVYASRLSLVSRWAWFKDNVSVVSVASSWLRVPLPDIASSALQFILEFLYTGKMPSLNARLNVILAVDIIRACKSKYFELPEVEETAMAYLKSRTYGGDAALELTLVEFAADGGASTASLIKCLSYAYGGLQACQLRLFSENALRLWLDNTKSTTPFSEYLRFRKIILWCATHASSPETTLKDIDAFVPGLQEVIAYLQVSPSRHEIGFDVENLKRLLIMKEYLSCAASLLEKVNFVHIHSVLLDAVVEPLVIPLGLVSEERLREAYKKAYRLQALPGTTKPPQYAWEHGDQYCTDDIGDGSVITKSELGMGLARYSVPAFQNHGVYEWTVVVEKPCPGYCELGFVVEYIETQREQGCPYGGYRRTVSGRFNGYCLKITPRTARTNQVDSLHDLWADFENDFDRLKVWVHFRLDMNKRDCSIAINNGHFFLAWDCLPANNALYFPAVCLGAKTGRQVRIKKVRGFDML